MKLDHTKMYVCARPFRWNGDTVSPGEKFDTSKVAGTKLQRLFEKGHLVCMSYEMFNADNPTEPNFEAMSVPELHQWLAMHGSAQPPGSRSRLLRKVHWMWGRLLEGKCTYDAAAYPR